MKYTSMSAAVAALNQQEVVALVGDLASVIYEIHTHHHSKISIVAATKYETEFSMAVRKDWPELIDILDKAIDTIDPKRKSEIKNDWMQVSVEVGVNYRTILIYVAFSLVAIFFIFWLIFLSYRRLKRQEAQLQKANNVANMAQADLEDQLAFQQAIIDSIPMPLFYKDEKTQFKGFNKAYEEAFSVTGEDLIGLTVMDLDYLPKNDREAYQAEDIETINTQGRVKREVKMRFSDGKMHDTLYSSSCITTA